MLKPVRLIVVALAGILSLGPRAVAQEVMVVTPGAAGPVVKVESTPTQPNPSAEPGKSGRRLGPDGKPMGEPGKPPVEPAKDAKPGEAKPGDSKAEEPPSISRPAKPPKPPDPKELAVRPDAQGRLSFNFRGQPWPAVLEWLAEVSGMSLDWQELPGDFLNLSTQRTYTVRETRDLINRHLLARGYTLLTQGEVLSVVNIKKLNPGLVPRVEPEQLATRDPYEFVKVSFPLDWMVADSAVEELKPMLSPNGKLTALRATNRIEAMDAVVNLREIHALLNAEQSNQGQERLVREFVLEHARATDVHEQLRALVGLETPPSGPMRGPGGPGQPSPEMQQRMMMMVQGGPGGPQPQPQPGQPQPGAQLKARAEVYLVVNARKNSIIAVAPPDKMAILAEAVKRLDAPLDRDASLSTTMNRVHVYRLASIDPEAIVKTLEELGNLDPTTRLQVDKKNRAIVANGPPWDHVMIRAVVQKLDGSERQFEVIQLRRLPADYVAGTIEFMMGGEKPKENRRSSYYYPFDFFGQDRRGQSDESQSKFRVEADVENNRLLLKANPIELEEVKQLLVKLGEMPAGAGRGSTVRTLDLPPGQQTDELLERIRRRWPGIAPNPLVLPPPSEDDEPAEHPRHKDNEKPKPSAGPGGKTPEMKPRTAGPTPSVPEAPVVAMVPIDQGAADEAEPSDPADAPGRAEPESAWRASEPDPGPRVRRGASASARSPATESPGDTRQPQGSPPPVTVTRGPDGRLIVSSSDTEALDRFEDLVAQSAPASPNDFRIFKLQYAWASGVATILRDVFKEEKKEERRSPWY
ncbi:MAG: hypothetical protein NUV77_03875, partial [Thermoguttaceae bacterium]|nr:hypothetical protein [Thermoguttaceae bacterium]